MQRVVLKAVSEILLIGLGQAMIATLRMQFSRQILASFVRHLEMLEVHRLFAMLPEDVLAFYGLCQ